MNKLYGSLAALALVAACSGDGEFSFSGSTSDDGTTDSGDTSDTGDTSSGSSGSGVGGTTVAINELLLEDAASGLSMTAFSFDDATGILSISGLPNDASNEAYTQNAAVPLNYNSGADFATSVTLASGFNAYESTTANSDATLNYYAVFRRSDSGNSQVVAAGTGNFSDLGHAGAGATRLNGATVLPSDGNYTYTGSYAGVRVAGTSATDDITYVTGETLLLIDFQDSGTGTVVGNVRNRQQFDLTGTLLTAPDDRLDDLSLTMSSIDRDNATIAESDVGIVGGSDTVGTWQGVFAGPNGEEIAGIVLLEESVSSTDIRETGAFIAD